MSQERKSPFAGIDRELDSFDLENHPEEIPGGNYPDWAFKLNLLHMYYRDAFGDRETPTRGGSVLDKYQLFVLMSELILDLDFNSGKIRVMNINYQELPASENHPTPHPSHINDLLDMAIDVATNLDYNRHKRNRDPVDIEIFLDDFVNFYRDGKMHWRDLLSNTSIPKKPIGLNPFNSHRDTKIESRNRQFFNPLGIIKSLFGLNPYALGIASRLSPTAPYTKHDHRKLAVLNFSNRKQAFFMTGNWDSPEDHDLGLVVTNKEIVNLIDQRIGKTPKHHFKHQTEDWLYLEDGQDDLDPYHPTGNSLIQDRFIERISDPNNAEIVITTQFLLDSSILKILETQLSNNSDLDIKLLFPALEQMNRLSMLTGGRKSLRIIKRLARKFSERFQVIFCQDAYMHAKSLYTKSRAGEQTLAITSHNFNNALSKSATAEYYFESQNPNLINFDDYLNWLSGIIEVNR